MVYYIKLTSLITLFINYPDIIRCKDHHKKNRVSYCKCGNFISKGKRKALAQSVVGICVDYRCKFVQNAYAMYIT